MFEAGEMTEEVHSADDGSGDDRLQSTTYENANAKAKTKENDPIPNQPASSDLLTDVYQINVQGSIKFGIY